MAWLYSSEQGAFHGLAVTIIFSNMNKTPLLRRIVFSTADQKTRMDVECIIDTGAAASIASLDMVDGIQIRPRDKAVVLNGPFGGRTKEIEGLVTLYVNVDHVRMPVEFIVIRNLRHPCLLGWPSIQELRLKVNYEGVFTHENRIFGEVVDDHVRHIYTTWAEESDPRQIQAVYNVQVSEKAKQSHNTAIDLGHGIFEDVGMGGYREIRTDGNYDPKVVHNFLASDDMVSTPTSTVESSNAERRQAIIDAFEKNQFNVSNELPRKDKTKLRELVLKYSKCISLTKDEVGNLPRWVEDFHQEFTVHKPVPCKVYPVNPIKSEFLCKEIETLLKLKVIEPIRTKTITSNLLAVKKKDGTMRCCADNRTTNKYTKPTNLILPRIDQISRQLMGHRFYISLDIQKAYWSVDIPEEQRCWYTLQCPACFATYQWRKMCMGSKNAGTVFSHMIQMHIIGDLNASTYGYIDDISSGFDTIDEGFHILETLLQRLCKFELKIGIKKMQLFCNKLEAFGMIYDSDGVEPTNDRIVALSTTVKPNDKKSLHSALASVNYYRNFVPGFSARAAKLFELTGEASRYDQAVVDKYWPGIIEALGQIIKVQVPDYSLPMILSTDACEFGLGMVLAQKDPNRADSRRILGCHSKGLNKSERLWSISQKELKGIYEGLVFFEQLLFNSFIVIETDNASVYWLLKLKIGSVEINKRLPAVRYLLYISSFNYEVTHVSGKAPSFLLSDYLSRNGYELGSESRFILGKTSKEPLIQLKAIINGKYDMVEVNNVEISGKQSVLSKHPLDKPESEIKAIVAAAQVDSKFCQKIKDRPGDLYEVMNDVLYRKTQLGLFLVCPRFFTQDFIGLVHDSLHENIRKTIEKINGMKIFVFQKYKNVVGYVQGCPKCGPAKSQACLKAKNKTVSRPHRCWDIVHVDLMNIGPTFVVVVIDSFSRYVVTRVLRDGTSVNIRDALADIFCHFGIPVTLVMDNGANLNSAVMTEFYKNLGIYVSNSTPMNSRANSLCEGVIGILQRRLRCFGIENGSLYLNLYLITHKVNLEIPKGRRYSPFHIMFTRESSWVLQTPDLSRIKYDAQQKSLKQLFDSAKSIQEEMLKQAEARRQKLKGEVAESQPLKLKKHDLVRIKKMSTKDTVKKAFRPFSETIWEVREVNRFTNTVLLKEIVEDGFQPRIRKVHVRFLKKVLRIADQSDDFEPGISKKQEEDETEIKNEGTTKGEPLAGEEMAAESVRQVSIEDSQKSNTSPRTNKMVTESVRQVSMEKDQKSNKSPRTNKTKKNERIIKQRQQRALEKSQNKRISKQERTVAPSTHGMTTRSGKNKR